MRPQWRATWRRWSQRSVARSQAELAELDGHVAALEVSLAAGEPDPNLCLEEGGDSDDELRIRIGLPVRTLLLTCGCGGAGRSRKSAPSCGS